MLGQLHEAGNTTTLAHYLMLLEGAGLIGGLEKYSPSVVRMKSSSPKLQVFNNALLSSQNQLNLSEIKSNPDTWGRVIESAVGTYLANESLRGKFKLFYWRDGNDEVDFIIESEGKLIGIEVKSSFSRNKKGMSTFKRIFSHAKTISIDNRILPWYEFIKINPEELF
jgi:predicted AAA+ superfamily ATPase